MDITLARTTTLPAAEFVRNVLTVMAGEQDFGTSAADIMAANNRVVIVAKEAVPGDRGCLFVCVGRLLLIWN